MNVYFDNRGGEHSYITIFCDDEKYGNVLADRDTVNLVKIPDGVQVLKISAVAVTDTYKGLERELIEDIELCFEKEEIGEFGFKNEKWQYPYDAILYLNGCNEDIFIYQCTFPKEELKYALGYKGRLMSDGSLIQTKYVKRIENFAVTSSRGMALVITGIVGIVGAVLFPIAVESYKDADIMGLHFETRLAVKNVIFAVGCILVSLLGLVDISEEKKLLQESKLKSEYYLDSDGNWSSSE